MTESINIDKNASLNTEAVKLTPGPGSVNEKAPELPVKAGKRRYYYHKKVTIPYYSLPQPLPYWHHLIFDMLTVFILEEASCSQPGRNSIITRRTTEDSSRSDQPAAVKSDDVSNSPVVVGDGGQVNTLKGKNRQKGRNNGAKKQDNKPTPSEENKVTVKPMPRKRAGLTKTAQNSIPSKECSDQNLSDETKVLDGSEVKLEIPGKKVYRWPNSNYRGKNFNPNYKKLHKKGAGAPKPQAKHPTPNSNDSKVQMVASTQEVLAGSEGPIPQNGCELSSELGRPKNKDSSKENNLSTNQGNLEPLANIERSSCGISEAVQYNDVESTKAVSVHIGTADEGIEAAEVPADTDNPEAAKILTDYDITDVEFPETSANIEGSAHEDSTKTEVVSGIDEANQNDNQGPINFDLGNSKVSEITMDIQADQDKIETAEIPADSEPNAENIEVFCNNKETNLGSPNAPNVLAENDHADTTTQTLPSPKNPGHDDSNLVEIPAEIQQPEPNSLETIEIGDNPQDVTGNTQIIADLKEDYSENSSIAEVLAETQSLNYEIESVFQKLWGDSSDVLSANSNSNSDHGHSGTVTPDSTDDLNGYYSSISDDFSTSYEEDAQSESSFDEDPADQEVPESYESETQANPDSIVARSTTEILGLSTKNDFDSSYEPSQDRVMDIFSIIFPKMKKLEREEIFVTYYKWLRADGMFQLPKNDKEIAKQLVYWTARYTLGGAQGVSEKGIAEEDVENMGKETEMYKSFGQVRVYKPRITTPEERVEILLLLDHMFPSMLKETAQMVAESYFKKPPSMFHPGTSIEERIYDVALDYAGSPNSFGNVRQELEGLHDEDWNELLRKYKTCKNINDFCSRVSKQVTLCSPTWLSWGYTGNNDSVERMVIRKIKNMYTNLPPVIEQEVLCRVFFMGHSKETILHDLANKIRQEVFLKARTHPSLLNKVEENMNFPNLSQEEIKLRAKEYVNACGVITYTYWGPVGEGILPKDPPSWKHQLLLKITEMYPYMPLESKACLGAMVEDNFNGLERRLRGFALGAAVSKDHLVAASAIINAHPAYKGLSEEEIEVLIQRAAERMAEKSELYQRWQGTWKDKDEEPKYGEEPEPLEIEDDGIDKEDEQGKFKMNPTAPVFHPVNKE
ncbi:hypothetical protein EDC01DRAFT_631000 [Geopyxis carbonaria]|nr:hypothetical protein EDC01DRAFT_631000 [Geopyxis carbonaria]